MYDWFISFIEVELDTPRAFPKWQDTLGLTKDRAHEERYEKYLTTVVAQTPTSSPRCCCGPGGRLRWRCWLNLAGLRICCGCSIPPLLPPCHTQTCRGAWIFSSMRMMGIVCVPICSTCFSWRFLVVVLLVGGGSPLPHITIFISINEAWGQGIWREDLSSNPRCSSASHLLNHISLTGKG